MITLVMNPSEIEIKVNSLLVATNMDNLVVNFYNIESYPEKIIALGMLLQELKGHTKELIMKTDEGNTTVEFSKDLVKSVSWD